MVDFKVVIADPKTGRCVQREIKDKDADALVGLKIGDKVKGDSIGLAGYEFQITGGSDYCGFPMRKDVSGSARKKITAVSGVGIGVPEDGTKQRKNVAGNTVFQKTAQVNLKITAYGHENIFPEVKKEEKAEKKEAKTEEHKEEPKPVKKEEKAEKKEEKVHEKKEEHKAEKKEEKVPEKKEEHKAEKKEEKAEKKEAKKVEQSKNA